MKKDFLRFLMVDVSSCFIGTFFFFNLLTVHYNLIALIIMLFQEKQLAPNQTFKQLTTVYQR